jgi:acyl-CoA synthetase (AMP-forming)/AMP-acid ligase II
MQTHGRDVLTLHRDDTRDLEAARLAVVAGAPVSRALAEELTAEATGLVRDISIVYGCSEAPTISQTVAEDPPMKRFGTVGRPTPGVEVRVAARGTSRAVETGEVGEVLVQGYNLMLSYLNDETATLAKYRGGWLVTDDLGILDSEGYLQIVGRASDMFTVGGFNVYPREVEAQLESHPAVIEAAVTGVPDPRLGAVPMAWLKVVPQVVLEDDILVWAKETMASYKRPRYVRIVQDLPKTASGKISRAKVEHLSRRALPHLDWEANGDR